MGISNSHLQLKEHAIELRKTGQSYRQISNKLGLARSTLSGWLKNIPISPAQKQQLTEQWKAGLHKAQARSCEVKREVKFQNIRESQHNAEKFLKNLTLDNVTLELFLAGLYLGDGFKVNGRLGLGNTNPQIVLLFISLIRKLYPIKEPKLSAEIFSRADQNPKLLVDYWSKLLHIPKSQFHRTQQDARAKTPTRANYLGVCAVNYNDVILQRRILAIGEEMIKYTNNPNKGL